MLIRRILWCLLFIVMVSCRREPVSGGESEALYRKVDSLQKRLDVLESKTTPHLGDLMNTMQLHHNRLWISGVHQDWKLSEYELKETEELLSRIQVSFGDQLVGNSTISNNLNSVLPLTDSIAAAIKARSKDDFVKYYKALTIQCNGCHQKAGYDFYEIIEPKSPAYSSDNE